MVSITNKQTGGHKHTHRVTAVQTTDIDSVYSLILYTHYKENINVL